jgi:hypothetical protein
MPDFVSLASRRLFAALRNMKPAGKTPALLSEPDLYRLSFTVPSANVSFCSRMTVVPFLARLP